MEELGEGKVAMEDIERFLRNVPNPVLLGVFGKDCSLCEEMEEGISNLPETIAVARITVEEPEDNDIVDALAVEALPTVIAFCHGEEIARTSDPSELGNLLVSLCHCGEAE